MSGEFILNPNFRPWVGCFLYGWLLPAAKATFFNYEPAQIVASWMLTWLEPFSLPPSSSAS